MSRIIVDVREPLEFKLGHVKGAINIPPSKMMSGVPDKLAGTPKDTEIILYCISGSRSNTATHILRQYGFTNLVNGINKGQVKAKYL
ncbi:MAG: rhodanese-like domain-containing protein [Candidatus Saccharimonadales bacterium]